MSRAINRLTVRKVETLNKAGRHADGGGLYLRITGQGSKSWSFLATYAGKRHEIGLGAVSSLGLAAARKVAAAMRDTQPVVNVVMSEDRKARVRRIERDEHGNIARIIEEEG